MLAARSRTVLDAYRQGRAIAPGCPLALALAEPPSATQPQ
mgnify:CR=1 FL=1